MEGSLTLGQGIILIIGTLLFMVVICIFSWFALLMTGGIKKHNWSIIKEFESNRYIFHTLKCSDCGTIKTVRLMK